MSIAGSRENFWTPECRTANGSDPTHGFGRWRISFEKRPAVCVEVVLIGPERYNDLYEKFGNLNSLLGWGHARVIENLAREETGLSARLVGQVCRRAGHRKFAASTRPHNSAGATDQGRIRSRGGGGFHPGAGSVHRLARAERKALGVQLGRGVSAQVKETAQEIVEKGGRRCCEQLAKVHFRTAHEIAPGPFRGAAAAAGMAKVSFSQPEAGKVPAL